MFSGSSIEDLTSFGKLLSRISQLLASLEPITPSEDSHGALQSVIDDLNSTYYEIENVELQSLEAEDSEELGEVENHCRIVLEEILSTLRAYNDAQDPANVQNCVFRVWKKRRKVNFLDNECLVDAISRLAFSSKRLNDIVQRVKMYVKSI